MGFALGGVPATISVTPDKLCHNACVQRIRHHMCSNGVNRDGSCSENHCGEIWAPDVVDPVEPMRTIDKYLVVCAPATIRVVKYSHVDD